VQQTPLGQSSSIGPFAPLPATQNNANAAATANNAFQNNMAGRPDNAVNPMADDSGMGRANGFGPQGPATFSPAYSATMASVSGQNMGNAYAKSAQMANGGMAMGGMAGGGISNLGGYSDGGRLLRGPGDGVSDSIPAQIGNNQPARLADGEFVVPARIVSELGNGSTEAGARQLYKMLDRVQQARGKTTGKSKVAKNTNAAKYLPA